MNAHLSILRKPAPAPGLVLILAMLGGVVGCGEPTSDLRYQDRLATVNKIAVLPFVDAPGDHAKGSGNIVVNAVVRALLQCEGIQVIERSRIKSVIDERKFQRAQLSDPSVASQIGKLAGAGLVFLGEVTQYEAQQEYGHVAVYVVSGGATERTHRVGLSVRAVDVSDGRIVYAELGQGVDKKGYSQAAKAAAEEVLKPLRHFYSITRGRKK